MKKLLIIDDDEIFPKVLTDSLPEGEYDVVHVVDGEKGLTQIEKEAPDLIILDLIMPKMTGLEFIKALKEKKDTNHIPILISSQLSKLDDIDTAIAEGIEVGTIGYIIKANENIDMIVNTIEKTLNAVHN